MKKILIIIGFIAVIVVPSCTKESISPTTADEITNQLKKVIADNGITKIIAWDDKGGFPTNIPPTLGNTWIFSNGFIAIYGYGGSTSNPYETLNLLYLDKYEISNVLLNNGTNPVALILHFRS